MKPTLYCATTNAAKVTEFRQAAAGICLIEPLPDLRQIDPPEETGATFEDNAAIKALYYSTHSSGPVFADDSGLEVDALQGEPGVYSARFAGENATDADNNRLVLERMQGVTDRTARFVSVIALASAGKLIATFRGTVEGELLEEPRGPHGFGYDPLFHYPPFSCTFGEADLDRKTAVSHRGAAMRAMLAYVESTLSSDSSQ